MPPPGRDNDITLTALLGAHNREVPRWRSLWRRTDYLGFPSTPTGAAKTMTASRSIRSTGASPSPSRRATSGGSPSTATTSARGSSSPATISSRRSVESRIEASGAGAVSRRRSAAAVDVPRAA